MRARRNLMRVLQLATGIHRIHHVEYSYGWLVWPLGVGWFPSRKAVRCGLRRRKHYHNCTLTGIY